MGGGRSLAGEGPAGAAAAYAAYLDTLPVRPHHGDGAFPRPAAAALAHALASGEGGPAGGSGPPWSGAWWTQRALVLGAAALAAAPSAPARRRDIAWAALLLPVGALLGTRLLAAMGGVELWRDAPAALRAAVFSGRLEGVPGPARSLLLRLGGEGEGEARRLRLARPLLALAAAAHACDLALLLAPAWRRPADPLVNALLVRYRGRIDGARRAGALPEAGRG
ncbi:MAG: hypothetical protein K6V73_02185 [Firmicutes bacterium]|nr:hypothetical protein [Bacillota bacterium]